MLLSQKTQRVAEVNLKTFVFHDEMSNPLLKSRHIKKIVSTAADCHSVFKCSVRKRSGVTMHISEEVTFLKSRSFNAIRKSQLAESAV